MNLMNAANLVIEAESRFGDKPALYFEGAPVSFARLMEMTALARGVIRNASTLR